MIPSSISVNDTEFLVLSLQDASMIPEAQEKHNIRMKSWRVETTISPKENSIFTPDVVMAAFFSADIFDPGDHIYTPVCLIEKKVGGDMKMLEAYYYDERTYSQKGKFTHTLNGFLGCTSFLNLGFYLLKILAHRETRSIYMIYFVDKHYLDTDKDDEQDCDTSIDTFLSLAAQERSP